MKNLGCSSTSVVMNLEFIIQIYLNRYYHISANGDRYSLVIDLCSTTQNGEECIGNIVHIEEWEANMRVGELSFHCYGQGSTDPTLQ